MMNWKDMDEVTLYFKVLFLNLPGEIEHKQALSRESNSDNPKHEVEVLTTRM
jgi:hypothetical protein